MDIRIIHSDCLEYLKTMPDNCVDSVVTDPPYGLSFMGKSWDYDVPTVEVWKEVFRVLKPGGHLLSFAGTRTYHRMAVNIEDSGFEIRDMIAWVYGSGFPKSMNIGKAIDKLQGNEREVIETNATIPDIRANNFSNSSGKDRLNAKVSIGTSEWEGWGTALKPAQEPICVARKPIEEKSIAENVLKYGTGGINIDGCRIDTEENLNGGSYGNTERESDQFFKGKKPGGGGEFIQPSGRFPANFIHDGSEEVLALFPGTQPSKGNYKRKTGETQFLGMMSDGSINDPDGLVDSGSAARFFYCAKASRSERNKGLEGLIEKPLRWSSGTQNPGSFQSEGTNRSSQNFHPTVKPVSLMQYLVRLVTPPNGTVLDPFNGSGTTGIACKLEGFNYIGIDSEADYVEISRKRIEAWEPDPEEVEDKQQLKLFS